MGAVIPFPGASLIWGGELVSVDLWPLGDGAYRVALRQHDGQRTLVGDYPHEKAIGVAFRQADHRGLNISSLPMAPEDAA